MFVRVETRRREDVARAEVLRSVEVRVDAFDGVVRHGRELVRR